jgi:hypothetical protein
LQALHDGCLLSHFIYTSINIPSHLCRVEPTLRWRQKRQALTARLLPCLVIVHNHSCSISLEIAIVHEIFLKEVEVETEDNQAVAASNIPRKEVERGENPGTVQRKY